MRLEYEGLHRAEAISTPGARYYNDPAAYAMDRYAYYVCFKCNKVTWAVEVMTAFLLWLTLFIIINIITIGYSIVTAHIILVTILQ